ncbi:MULTISPECIES: DNA repair protein RecO [unclassified Leptolyngbya]|uniref:DNA repair protein RecO n=1 Tax=unclassified Leptolyngbya TaxID=2650499 RepID=UPI001686902C|nr:MULTISPECIES: DNA repair protein RecO [unclassified Leptolyngbya]MBD1910140.1 DNA repair protein RecO [Leptolyngbya sp. FACHB-8]MBD2153572.1 DNA repair protein RecO [Leptolyngbya sp. FACHB-16]
MPGTYKATGINLKGVPMGESDRLLTILTREYGLLRAVAPGSRKHESGLRGRSGLFVVNDLFLAKGRGLDKIIQADSLESFPKLSLDLRKLTAAQYLAELALYQALSEQPQHDLFDTLQASLSQLEQADGEDILPLLVQGIMQMIRLAGVAPEVELCSVTRKPIAEGNTQARWQAGFHPAAGGLVQLSVFDKITHRERYAPTGDDPAFPDVVPFANNRNSTREGEAGSTSPEPKPSAFQTQSAPTPERRDVQEGTLVRQSRGSYRSRAPVAGTRLTANELALLRQLGRSPQTGSEEPFVASAYPSETWLAMERALRYYAQYHLERTIQSASLMDSCFAPLPSTVLPHA